MNFELNDINNDNMTVEKEEFQKRNYERKVTRGMTDNKKKKKSYIHMMNLGVVAKHSFNIYLPRTITNYSKSQLKYFYNLFSYKTCS